ncbi:MAG: hypothetical protein COU07_02635 [Candidatus Harrisonbacteria bacterium CG10_big_fil_rev_8_21_14_0_10_40_38]|uniref:AAA+ ATPase domain-containing protein n=1 Tax=Candidatus Harrisonbacteria bacterium CG10_big_fil_rev_8_21_14_0_10_40_38 TaxID=1974583 RepID=A0A2H0URS9_9BACT|nr:MAG: hypothetical protein COU07_02635 [Candidatus Harrisonbacteria bacterium CG10_big_fil_rev_8_21_14_0_10_40_38]
MLHIPENEFKKILVGDKVITAEQFDKATSEARRMGTNVANILLEQNLITTEYYQTLLSKFYNLEPANLGEKQINEEVFKLIPENIARQKRIIVFGKEQDGTIDVAMEDPSDLITIEYLTNHLKSKIKPFLASRDDMNQGLAIYGQKVAEDFSKEIEKNIQASLKNKLSSRDVKEAATDLPIVSLTDNLLSYAMALHTSDIHIEVLETEVLVRFRIDGILHEIMRIPKEVHTALVARFKFLSGLKLDEHVKPQDGRFRHKVGIDVIDIRVSIIPTFYGEKVEMRLLSATERPLSFEELGLFSDTINAIKKNITKTYGMILVTGPTGSGKTTTLYSIMAALNKTEINIVTIEDPIEYYMKYVNQIQVNSQAGITFANGLRAILRQDPNVVMVGEIRDEETAEISVHAALTGHLVLSSIHTNDAPTAIPRFIDLKVAPFLAAAVMNLIIAQRLVRRLCMTCIQSYKVEDEMQKALQKQMNDLGLTTNFQIPKTMFKGKGCSACNGTGYKGRIGIYEVLNISEDVRKYIVEPDFSLDGLKEIAKKEGFISMFEDGLRKVERGVTTLEEILRVIRE